MRFLKKLFSNIKNIIFGGKEEETKAPEQKSETKPEDNIQYKNKKFKQIILNIKNLEKTVKTGKFNKYIPVQINKINDEFKIIGLQSKKLNELRNYPSGYNLRFKEYYKKKETNKEITAEKEELTRIIKDYIEKCNIELKKLKQ